MVSATKGIYIVAAKRTPFGTYGGKLMKFSATDLQEVAMKAALTAGCVNPEIVDSVVVGNVFHVSHLAIDITFICSVWCYLFALVNLHLF